MNTIDLEDRLGISFCNRQSVAIERGEGAWVWDEAGKKYLDFTSGWGVTCLGHSHPVISSAIYTQANKIIQNPNSGFTYSPSRARLLSLLTDILPGDLCRVFFCNSGAEANDAAIKLARKITGKSKVVSALASFHGRTFNTLTISGGKENVSRYLPSLQENVFVPFSDIDAMELAIDKETAAVILEPVQGEGGVRVPDKAYLERVALLCKEAGALFIVDEIQTGFCRTGKMFALQHGDTDLVPDILTMGKGIAGGFPFAAFAMKQSVHARIEKGDHGGTYCGNPLGCAVASTVVEYLVKADVAAKVETMGAKLLEGIEELASCYPQYISSVRGLGLLCALEMLDDALVSELSVLCLEKGLLVTPTRNRVIRLIPSLLVSEFEMSRALAILDEALSSLVRF